MPRLPDPKSARWRALRVASICVGIASSQSCMDPVYFEGPPPAPATMSVSVLSVDTLPSSQTMGRLLVRVHLALDWNIVGNDFRKHAHLVDLADWQKSHSRIVPLPTPSGTLQDSFTCVPGQVTARLLADLGSGYLLELSKQSVATEATRP